MCPGEVAVVGNEMRTVGSGEIDLREIYSDEETPKEGSLHLCGHVRKGRPIVFEERGGRDAVHRERGH